MLVSCPRCLPYRDIVLPPPTSSSSGCIRDICEHVRCRLIVARGSPRIPSSSTLRQSRCLAPGGWTFGNNLFEVLTPYSLSSERVLRFLQHVDVLWTNAPHCGVRGWYPGRSHVGRPRDGHIDVQVRTIPANLNAGDAHLSAARRLCSSDPKRY